jgi:hypothetical protein
MHSAIDLKKDFWGQLAIQKAATEIETAIIEREK